MKNKTQLDGMPVWFDGKSINEALFCEEFLQTHKIIFTNGAFFTPEGRVTDELPLRGEIFEELKCCAVSNIPRKISNIVELMKLAALVEDFPPEPDPPDGSSRLKRNCLIIRKRLSRRQLEERKNAERSRKRSVILAIRKKSLQITSHPMRMRIRKMIFQKMRCLIRFIR